MNIDPLIWIIVGGILMSAIALIGALAVFIKPKTLDRILLLVVSVAAGTLLGGAFFHMIPEGARSMGVHAAGAWVVAGFTVFLGLEQFLHWHQSHRSEDEAVAPVTYLILIGDAIHNFIGGLAISGTFLVNPQAGIIAWIAAVAHEIPQEIGDYGILVHGGFSQRKALFWNYITALTFPLGGIIAYIASREIELGPLILFGAGNFLYIAASDLVPEIKSHKSLANAFGHYALFIAGVAITLILALAFHD